MTLSRTKPNRILLVYPKIPQNTFWSYSHSLPFVNKKSSIAPLGLITLASLFPSQYELKLIDMNVETLKDEDILANFLTDLENGVASKKYAAENRPDLSHTRIPPRDFNC